MLLCDFEDFGETCFGVRANSEFHPSRTGDILLALVVYDQPGRRQPVGCHVAAQPGHLTLVRGQYSWHLMLLPLYTGFSSLVMTPLGVVWYAVMAIRDRNVLLNMKDYAGLPVMGINGIPWRVSDQLLNTEARVI